MLLSKNKRIYVEVDAEDEEDAANLVKAMFYSNVGKYLADVETSSIGEHVTRCDN